MSTCTHRLVIAAAAAAAAGAAFAQAEIEPLRVLALSYQEAGDHAPAIMAFEEARHVTRVHNGLSSVEEALLLRQQIPSEEARGNYARVWALEQDMVTIARQHLDDIRTVPIFRELAEDRVDALNRYFVGAIPPEIYLGCYYAAGLPRYDDTRGERRPAGQGSCHSGGKSGAMRRLLAETLMYYADAIEVIVRNGDYASQELRDLEKQALRIGFNASYPWLPTVGNAVTDAGLHRRLGGRCSSGPLDELLAVELLGTCLDPVIHVDGVVYANVGSWVSLVRLLFYAVRSAAPAAVRANALAELADWHLFSTLPGRRRFDESGQRALELYERLYRELQQDDDLRASSADIFSPRIPITLPTFVPNPFVSAAAAESSRYIDVAFAITKYGRGESIEILATNDATRADEKDVIKLIVGTTFRPRVVDGELAAADPVVLRYHLTPHSLQEARQVRLALCERAGVCQR
jgi:hypothetical protein